MKLTVTKENNLYVAEIKTSAATARFKNIDRLAVMRQAFNFAYNTNLEPEAERCVSPLPASSVHADLD